MPNASMAVKDSCQEQGVAVLAFPISRGEKRKSIVPIALLLQSEQSRSYCVLQKHDGAVGKRFEEEVVKEQRNKNPPFTREEGPNSWDLVQQGPVSGSDEPLKCDGAPGPSILFWRRGLCWFLKVQRGSWGNCVGPGDHRINWELWCCCREEAINLNVMVVERCRVKRIKVVWTWDHWHWLMNEQ